MSSLIQAGMDIKPIITHHFPLEKYIEGFETMCSGNSGKVILEWSK
jgi:threonine 3-dehydrogenase